MVNPAKLAWGLARSAERRGARIAEGSRVTRLRRRAGRMEVRVDGGGVVEAAHVLVGTSAYSGWLRRLAPAFVPVYDYVLMTEPLTEGQRTAVGWRGREGLSDAGNQFHYFRQSADHRILWGGYDAVYHPGNARPGRVRPAPGDVRHARAPLHRRPSRSWTGSGSRTAGAGAIDTTTRFAVTFGETMGGRVHYALGYTGLGVGATRWAAGILRDRVLRPDSELLRLRFVNSAPFPIPPEPIRTPAVEVMRRAVIAADANEGRRGLFLRAMDALGIGFDS